VIDISEVQRAEDFFTDDFFADPAPTYHRFRAVDPVLELPFDLNLEQAQMVAGASTNTWLVTGFDAVFDVLRDPLAYSSSLPSPDGRPMTEAEQGRLVLINSDPPRHTGLRQMINRAFTPRKVAALEPMIRACADRLVSAIPRDEPVDLMPLLCEPLPIIVIAELLGIDDERRADFKRWSDAMVATADADTIEANLTATGAMHAYFVDEVARRRADPTDDLVSLFATALLDGKPLQDWEAISFCVLILLAGNETTRSLLGSMLTRVAGRPGLWSRLRADPTLADAVVEEALRMDSPVQILNRWTTREVDLHGHTLPARANVAVAYAAANLDPAVFADPDEFRIDRAGGRQLAFGAGAHLCVGAPLARAEGRLVLQSLLDRFEEVAIAGDGPRFQRDSRVVRGPRTLPLCFR
jgi:cytochrome P450